MAANVESMFYVRETPWHGLGTRVSEAPDSQRALIVAGLNWNVVQEPVYTGEDELYISHKLTILHGQSDHLSRRFRSLISERDSRRSKSFL